MKEARGHRVCTVNSIPSTQDETAAILSVGGGLNQAEPGVLKELWRWLHLQLDLVCADEAGRQRPAVTGIQETQSTRQTSLKLPCGCGNEERF